MRIALSAPRNSSRHCPRRDRTHLHQAFFAMSEKASFTVTQGIARRQVFLMALTCALAVSTIYYHQPLLPQMASTFGVTVARGSLIATLTQLGYAMGLLLFVRSATASNRESWRRWRSARTQWRSSLAQWRRRSPC